MPRRRTTPFLYPRCEGLRWAEHPLYSRWSSLKSRCLNPDVVGYVRYGARGITLCAEWLHFPTFVAWMRAAGWVEGSKLSIDRIDNDKGYSPDNCRLATCKVQSNNMRSNRLITIDGVTRTMQEWADLHGVPYQRLAKRVYKGLPLEMACTTPGDLRTGKLLTLKGRTQNVMDWSKELGLKYMTIYSRVLKGLSDEACLSTTVRGRKSC